MKSRIDRIPFWNKSIARVGVDFDVQGADYGLSCDTKAMRRGRGNLRGVRIIICQGTVSIVAARNESTLEGVLRHLKEERTLGPLSVLLFLLVLSAEPVSARVLSRLRIQHSALEQVKKLGNPAIRFLCVIFGLTWPPLITALTR